MHACMYVAGAVETGSGEAEIIWILLDDEQSVEVVEK